jgi:aspartyl-tRNA(Asn)/glutamyl-tRNA(Gln) amidotransferase subunit A
MSKEWLWQTASDLGRGIAAGEIDPIDLCETYLDAIDAHQYTNRIYTIATPDRARAEAAAASKRAKLGQRLSPLDGVPISWKDLFDSANTLTEAGSDLLNGRIPKTDAHVLDLATKAGLVCLGKTHMSELAFSGLGLNPIKETSPCVNDYDAVSGGSSSGAATSVAFGLAAIGIGSDTGGSVRIPAAWNDLVGLKTTHDRLSREGVVPLCDGFDTVGPLCRSVEDANEIFAIMDGSTPADLTNSSIEGKRFAVCNTLALDSLETGPAQAFEQSLKDLTQAGAIIEHIDIPEVASAMDLAACLFTTEAYAQWEEELLTQGDKMYPAIYDRFMAGQKYSGSEYFQSRQRLLELRKTYAQKTSGFDAVLIPSSPVMPPNVERLLTEPEYYLYINLLALRNTRIGNMMGLCALSIPTRTPSCGLMVMGLPNQDQKMLRLCSAIEPLLT